MHYLYIQYKALEWFLYYTLVNTHTFSWCSLNATIPTQTQIYVHMLYTILMICFVRDVQMNTQKWYFLSWNQTESNRDFASLHLPLPNNRRFIFYACNEITGSGGTTNGTPMISQLLAARNVLLSSKWQI